MKKYGFTLMEVMLSVILFSLMVGGILGAYTKIQSANIKMANTQEAIQAAESFLERINDTSIGYLINTGAYEGQNVSHEGKRKIITGSSLALKDKENPNNNPKFTRGCKSGTNCNCNKSPCTIWLIQQGGTKIDLINNDKVTVNNLEFEIYPDQQYVNINITAKNLQGESLYKSGITLSSTIGYKFFRLYPGELTPETLCEDVCSASQVGYSANNALDSNASFTQIYNNNTSQLSSCVGEGVQTHSFFFGLFKWNTSYGITMYEFARQCKNAPEDKYISQMKTTCGEGCTFREGNINPMSCGYIRNVMETDTGYNGTSCNDYDSYVGTIACKQLCVASIFTCSDNDMIKKTGILIETGDKAGRYLQNPKEESLTFTGTVYDNGWKCSSGNPSRYWEGILFWGERRYRCNNGDIRCDYNSTVYSDITESQYKNGCKIPRQAQINGSIYLDQEKNPGKESCLCLPRYGFSIYVDNGFVEDAGCAGGQERQTNTNLNQPIYGYVNYEQDLSYKSRNNELKTWRGQAPSLDDNTYVGEKVNAFTNYNLCSCNNQEEYDACIASGCCTNGAQVHQYSIDPTCNLLDNVIDVLENGYYTKCTNLIECIGAIFGGYGYDGSKWETYTKGYCEYLGGKWRYDSNKYKCYLNGTTRKDYCEKTQGGTRINNKCYKTTQNLTCQGGIVQNNTCYNNQVSCSAIQGNTCYSALEQITCNGELIGNLCYSTHSYCNNLIGNTCYNSYTDCSNLCDNQCYQSKIGYNGVYGGKYYQTKTELDYYYNGRGYSYKNTCYNTPNSDNQCKFYKNGELVKCDAIEKVSGLFSTSYYCYRGDINCDAIGKVSSWLSTSYYCYKGRIQECPCQNSNKCYQNVKTCELIQNNNCYVGKSSCITGSSANTCYSNPTNLETECTSRGGVQLIINGGNINCYKSNTQCTLVNNGTCYTSQTNRKQTCENEEGYYTGKNGNYYCYKDVAQPLENYCSETNGTMRDNVCYGNIATLDTNHNGFMGYSCILYGEHESKNVKRESEGGNRGCYSNDSPCRDYKCVRENTTNQYNDSKCTSLFGEDRIVLKNNNNTTTKRCEYSEFSDCIKGDTKNIYKDYTYGCDLSITSQSSMILNIIDTIGKFSAGRDTSQYHGFRIFGFRIY